MRCGWWFALDHSEFQQGAALHDQSAETTETSIWARARDRCQSPRQLSTHHHCPSQAPRGAPDADGRVLERHGVDIVLGTSASARHFGPKSRTPTTVNSAPVHKANFPSSPPFLALLSPSARHLRPISFAPCPHAILYLPPPRMTLHEGVEAHDQMTNTPERFLGWREVQPLFGGISRTTAWRGVRDGWLPCPVQVSPGRQAWKASDVAAWQERLEHRRAPTAETPGSRNRGRSLGTPSRSPSD